MVYKICLVPGRTSTLTLVRVGVGYRRGATLSQPYIELFIDVTDDVLFRMTHYIFCILVIVSGYRLGNIRISFFFRPGL